MQYLRLLQRMHWYACKVPLTVFLECNTREFQRILPRAWGLLKLGLQCSFYVFYWDVAINSTTTNLFMICISILATIIIIIPTVICRVSCPHHHYQIERATHGADLLRPPLFFPSYFHFLQQLLWYSCIHTIILHFCDPNDQCPYFSLPVMKNDQQNIQSDIFQAKIVIVCFLLKRPCQIFITTIGQVKKTFFCPPGDPGHPRDNVTLVTLVTKVGSWWQVVIHCCRIDTLSLVLHVFLCIVLHILDINKNF